MIKIEEFHNLLVHFIIIQNKEKFRVQAWVISNQDEETHKDDKEFACLSIDIFVGSINDEKDHVAKVPERLKIGHTLNEQYQ